MKEIIREEDIESVILSDESAVCVYTKMKDTMTYATSYSYRTLEEGKTFCTMCGYIYPKEGNEICPACKGNNLDTISYKEMPRLIMDMIDDHVKVSIKVRDDDNMHEFFIPEKTKCE